MLTLINLYLSNRLAVIIWVVKSTAVTKSGMEILPQVLAAIVPSRIEVENLREALIVPGKIQTF
jgi:hypothetical protein